MTVAFRLAAALLAALTASGEAHSQTYPVRPVRFLVGSPPGSGNDLVSRLLAQRLTERLGQPFIVEHKPGGAGLLANAALAKSPPDGHTLVLLSGAHPATAALNRALPYDPVRDFGMVGTLVAYPLVISVAPDSPIRSLADLVERAKWVCSGAVAAMGGEKQKGLISPIVAEARRTVLFVEGKDREKLDGADAEILQVGNLLDEPSVSAALRRRDARARMAGEPADMHLVNDRLRKGLTEKRIPLPVICARVDDHALQGRSGIVPRTPCGLAAASFRPGNAFPVWIEQYLVAVETQPPLGVERPGDPVSIDLTRSDAGHKDVPIMVGSVGPRVEIDDPRRHRGVLVIEQQQLRSRAVLSEDAEIGAAGDERRAQREALTL